MAGQASWDWSEHAFGLRLGRGKQSSLESDIEHAIRFLSAQFYKHKVRREKNVIIHSINSGLYLSRLKVSRECVIAGILHDVLENCPAARTDLQKQFGKDVLDLVLANSADKSRGDWKQRFKQTLKQCAKRGPEAFYIKAADLIDNTHRSLYSGSMERILKSETKLKILQNELKKLPTTKALKQIRIDLRALAQQTEEISYAIRN